MSGNPTQNKKNRPKGTLARFVVTLALVLGVGMGGQLALTTALDDQAFVMSAKRQESRLLAYQLSDLRAQVTQAGSVTSLARKAAALGMKPDPRPVVLRLPEDKAEVGKQ